MHMKNVTLIIVFSMHERHGPNLKKMHAHVIDRHGSCPKWIYEISNWQLLDKKEKDIFSSRMAGMFWILVWKQGKNWTFSRRLASKTHFQGDILEFVSNDRKADVQKGGVYWKNGQSFGRLPSICALLSSKESISHTNDDAESFSKQTNDFSKQWPGLILVWCLILSGLQLQA